MTNNLVIIISFFYVRHIKKLDDKALCFEIHLNKGVNINEKKNKYVEFISK